MNHILITTDFSDQAKNAMEYGLALARTTNANVTLFNSYHVPMMVDAGTALTVSFEEFEEDSLREMEGLRTSIRRRYPDMVINTVSKAGMAVDEILDYCGECYFDMVVMGIGNTGKVGELFGSTATAVASGIKAPVLIVPANARFTPPANVVFAYDFHEIKNADAIKPFIRLCNYFMPFVTLVNVVDSTVKLSPMQALYKVQVENLFAYSNLRHRIEFIEDKKVISGLEKYLDNHQVDMITMIKRKVGIFAKLMHASYTRKMAFHTHIPLLILHE